MSVPQFVELMRKHAPKLGLSELTVPEANILRDVVNGRHWPAIPILLIIRHATDGDVDAEHWVRDLYVPPEHGRSAAL